MHERYINIENSSLSKRKKKRHQKCELISKMYASPSPCRKKQEVVRNTAQLQQGKKSFIIKNIFTWRTLFFHTSHILLQKTSCHFLLDTSSFKWCLLEKSITISLLIFYNTMEKFTFIIQYNVTCCSELKKVVTNRFSSVLLYLLLVLQANIVCQV